MRLMNRFLIILYWFFKAVRNDWHQEFISDIFVEHHVFDKNGVCKYCGFERQPDEIFSSVNERSE